MPQTYHHALNPGTRIENYEIRNVLGVGGFGITYKGYDHSLHCDVAIKEYLPNELALRTTDGTTVIPKSDKDKKSYEYGLKRFLDEARTLAKFREPNVVRVTRFLECNGTAYLVMDYEDGQSLAQYLNTHTRLTEAQLMAIFLPLLQSLKGVHAKDYLHRDIKPANIYLRRGGSPVLLDFGAARIALGGQTHTITGMVTPGYAPFEQYHTRVRQGPWTDLYAIGATMYKCITGNTPVDATERVAALQEEDKDPLVPASIAARGQYSDELLAVIDWMLKPNAKDRPQDIESILLRLASLSANTGKTLADQEVQIDKTMKVDFGAENLLNEPDTTDEKKAAELTKKIASNGDISAQLKMSVMYSRGRGVSKDTEKAAEWCSRAAEQGNAMAQYKLAMLYAHGYGKEQDDKQAFRWCKLAADQGHAAAQFNLGLMYAAGKGVSQDKAGAVFWYRKAAEQGHAGARYNLKIVQHSNLPKSGKTTWLVLIILTGAVGTALYFYFGKKLGI